MQQKDERSWMLHNVLGAAKLPPVSKSYATALMLPAATPKMPALVGKCTTLTLPNCGGLPADLSTDERTALRLAIIQAVVRQLIVWEEPVMVGTVMTFTISNVHEPENSGQYLVPIVLRAKTNFRGRPAWDNIKLHVEEGVGSKFYFGRCMVFFQDNKGSAFVGVRWYKNQSPNGDVLDPTVMLPRLKLASVNVSIRNVHECVSILPASAIINGALLIPFNDEYWVMQSSMEQGRYVFKNQ